MKIATVGAALLAAALASPAAAQEVIYNPGYCAQFYIRTPIARTRDRATPTPAITAASGWHNGYAWIGPRPGATGIAHQRGY